MSTSSKEVLRALQAKVEAKRLKKLSEDMYVPLSVIKDFAMGHEGIQFVIMKSCSDEQGFDLREAAFAPPPASSTIDKDFITYPDFNKKSIVLNHDDVMWDLLVPIPGQEDAFWLVMLTRLMCKS